MTTINDKYGRAVTIKTVAGNDVYSVDGMSVSFPTGTSQSTALAAIDGMAPANWTPPPVVPQSVPLWAVRVILTERGLLDQATAAVAASDNIAVKTIWEYGNFVDRNSPALAALATALGISNDLDAMFITAGAMTA